MKYAFIEHNRRHWPVSVLCEVLEISPSGYHQRRPHQSRVSSDALHAQAKAIHAQVKGEYSPRLPSIWR
jgi:hypothetical protein